MNLWILGLIALLLVVFASVREGIDSTLEATCGTLGKRVVVSGTPIRAYTKSECDTLRGRFNPKAEFGAGLGECTKPTGGSFTWDCRTLPETPAGAGRPPSAAAPPPPGAGGSAAVTSGTTTGGTSASSFGPNSGDSAGMGDRRKQVFGPIAMGRGDGDGVVPMDSSKTNQYPELLGGGDSRPSTRIEGAGIVPPSKSWQLSNDGSLPTTESLKSSVPGDKDLIPDPYRVSQQFMTSSYSFKTDPVPFLTDFSAFQK